MTEGGAGAAPPPTPEAARDLFGPRVGLAERYVAMLADTGISHGLLGPREAPRLWERHVLNCAVTHPAFDDAAAVVDIGSGAGLPGLVLAICRADLQLHLVEPLQRRTVWLERTVEQLGLGNVTVHRARAEDLWGERRFRHATARAVAGIGELGRIALPLLEAGGSLHALKGARGAAELAADHDVLAAAGAARTWVHEYGAGVVDPPTMLICVAVDREISGPASPARRSPRTRRRR